MNLASRRLLSACAAVFAMVGVVAAGAPVYGADDISDGQWYVNYLNLAVAHQSSQGDGIRIAVIDSGVDANHPDLLGSVAGGADFTRDGPGDGLTDSGGHGTSMASLIVGHGRVRGVAPKATVVSVRATEGGFGGPSSVNIGAAIEWAVGQGIKILSISLSTSTQPDLATQQAIQKAVASGVVIVVGVGNKPNLDAIGYPANYPGVLAVAGLDKKGELSSISVGGANVALAAPADGVSSAFNLQRRIVATGTSNSTALTAGAVALVWAKYPDLSAADVVHRLTATATDKGAPGRDPEYGFGALNIVAALTADVPRLPAQASAAPTETEFVSSSPIPAPGSEFPAGIALAIGLGCLVVVLVAAMILFLVIRSRRRV